MPPPEFHAALLVDDMFAEMNQEQRMDVIRLIADYTFGILFNLGIFILGRGIGIHDVKEASSYGLGPLISILGAVDVLWAQKMWGSTKAIVMGKDETKIQ